MKKTLFPFADTAQFSSIFLDLASEKEALKPFYGLAPRIENFEKQIHQKIHFPDSTRQTLHQALNEQYRTLDKKPQLAIDLLLKNNTFTLTTGHQLNVFTGTLYFHYKIITVIKAARRLRQEFPNYNFVPVYWMASEDHDFEEIRSFRLFGKNYSWESKQKGAVGRFELDGLAEVISQTPEMDELFRRAYTSCRSLAEATQLIVNELYGTEGLVIIDGDDPKLKKIFQPILQSELFEKTSEAAVKTASEALEKSNYKAQVFPREINLFYLHKNIRERIVHENDRYNVLNTSLSFSPSEMQAEVLDFPERFSPNVILRPVYQEVILPNLSYTGGPGELAYWLQLKGVFEQFAVPFPILLPRNFALVLDVRNQHKLKQLGLNLSDLFLGIENLRKKWLAAEITNPVSLDSEKMQIEAHFEEIIQKAASVDPSLRAFAEAEKQRLINSLDNIAKKIKKAEQNKHLVSLNQLNSLMDNLFPSGSLQERVDNFLNFYLNDRSFLAQLMEAFDPFDLRFHVLELEESAKKI
jgi:bacillithiol synthase